MLFRSGGASDVVGGGRTVELDVCGGARSEGGASDVVGGRVR